MPQKTTRDRLIEEHNKFMKAKMYGRKYRGERYYEADGVEVEVFTKLLLEGKIIHTLKHSAADNVFQNVKGLRCKETVVGKYYGIQEG